MGNQESFGYDRDDDRFDGIDTLGYRVLGVQPNSPASSAGLVSFFDFLVGCDGRMLLGRSVDDDGNEIGEDEEEYDDIDFPALLRDNVGKELEMLVWNIKSQTQRFVKIVPSSSWGGTGLLGVTIRLDDYAEADERLIRVLSIEHNSPAAIAGLEPLTDYLLGTTTVSFDDDASLAHVLRQHVDRVVELYVYNTESDVVRVVTLMPTLSWGGAGLLGAEVGTGYLHRLPRHCRGTGGSSVERKVRTGARVQPAAAANSASTANPGAEAAPDANGGGGGDAVLSREEAGLVDLTASVNGGEQDTEIHLEPQLEFEPDPESPMSHHRAAVTVAGLQAEAPLVKLESSESEPAPVPAPAPAPEPEPEQPESVPASAPEPEPEQTPAEEPPNQSEKADMVVTQETQEPSEESGGSGKGAASVSANAEPPAEQQQQQQQSASSASSEQQAPPAPPTPAANPVPPPPPAAAATAEAAFSAPPPPPAAPPKETAVPPPPPPPPAAATDTAAAFSAPPPPPPPPAAAAPQMPAPPPGAAPFAMPPPPSFGETISYGGGPIPPPPPPPPGAYGAYGGGLPPPPIANVADSPEKSQGEVDLR